MFQTKVVEEMKTRILRPVTFSSRKSCLFEVMCKNILQLGGLQMAIWRMSIACWIPKDTNPHSHM